MTTSTLHTPLEELLFFQSLRANGIHAESFNNISDTLKANEFIHGSESYDPERLNPGNLQQLYLRLLKEEVRSANHPSPKQDGEQNGRKRKLSTPPLQSIDDAAQHSHLLPRLIDRLYARYQSHIVQAIKEEEKVYADLEKSIAEIERGEWDARIQAEVSAHNDSQSTQPLDNLPSKQVNKGEALGGKAAVADDGRGQERAGSTGQQAGRASLQGPLQDQKAPGVGIQRNPVQVDASQSTPREPTHNQSHFQPATPGYAAPSPAGEHGVGSSRGAPPGGPPLPDSTSGPLNPTPAVANARSPYPPKGVEFVAEQSRSAQHSPAQQSAQGHLPNLPSHPNIPPSARTIKQQPYGYGSPQPPYPQYSPYGPPGAGYPQGQNPAMPPYAAPNQPIYPNPYQHPGGQYQQHSPFGSFPGFTPGQPPARQNVPHQPPQSAFTTPQPSAAARRQGLTPINTAVSSTKWKSTPRPAKGIPRSPTPPERSPYLPSSPEPSPEPDFSTDRNVSKQSNKFKEAASRGESTPTRGRGRGRWGAHPGRGRGGRATSASHESKDTPTRSQSVASHTDELSTDPAMRRNIKPEQPSTPLPMTEDNSAISTPASTARPGRRNTLRGLELARPGNKRKRANTLEGSPGIFVPQTPHLPSRAGHILASRNFPRIVAPLMNDINSHKLASLFAKPITDRDAPGYHSLVYRSQDLKRIRGAISHGSRAVAAVSAAADSSVAASADESGAAATPPAGTPSLAAGKSSTVWIERGPDVRPPRGIVNSAQLEMEITRIFANAVMFNTDPHRSLGPLLKRRRLSSQDDDDDDSVEGHYEVDDGGAFVRDAREMFEEVERSVGRWRAAERVDRGAETRMRGGDGRDESEVDELAEEEGESSRGRRARG